MWHRLLSSGAKDSGGKLEKGSADALIMRCNHVDQLACMYTMLTDVLLDEWICRNTPSEHRRSLWGKVRGRLYCLPAVAWWPVFAAYHLPQYDKCSMHEQDPNPAPPLSWVASAGFIGWPLDEITVSNNEHQDRAVLVWLAVALAWRLVTQSI